MLLPRAPVKPSYMSTHIFFNGLAESESESDRATGERERERESERQQALATQ